jgi:hypothetical protein
VGQLKATTAQQDRKPVAPLARPLERIKHVLLEHKAISRGCSGRNKMSDFKLKPLRYVE